MWRAKSNHAIGSSHLFLLSMSIHGLKAVAIQFSWRGRQVVCSCKFSFFTFHASTPLSTPLFIFRLKRNWFIIFIKTRRTSNDCIIIIATRSFAGDVIEEVITGISKLGILGYEF